MEHHEQTKADWEDSREAWRREDGRRPKTKGHATRGNHGAAGTTGRRQAAESVQGSGSLPSGLDHRKNQEVTPVKIIPPNAQDDLHPPGGKQ